MPLYCYLNNGSIELPTSIPRSMFDRELDYYGITSAENLITVEDSVVTTLKSFKKAEREFMKIKREHEMCLLALECNNQFYQSCNALGDRCTIRIKKGHKLFDPYEDFFLLDKYLGRYGLMVDQRGKIYLNRDGGYFRVCTKKREYEQAP